METTDIDEDGFLVNPDALKTLMELGGLRRGDQIKLYLHTLEGFGAYHTVHSPELFQGMTILAWRRPPADV